MVWPLIGRAAIASARALAKKAGETAAKEAVKEGEVAVTKLPYMGKPAAEEASKVLLKNLKGEVPEGIGSKITPRRINPDEGYNYNFKKGGSVKRRIDGVALRGKTRGR